jgi:hypothetical protein
MERLRNFFLSLVPDPHDCNAARARLTSWSLNYVDLPNRRNDNIPASTGNLRCQMFINYFLDILLKTDCQPGMQYVCCYMECGRTDAKQWTQPPRVSASQRRISRHIRLRIASAFLKSLDNDPGPGLAPRYILQFAPSRSPIIARRRILSFMTFVLYFIAPSPFGIFLFCHFINNIL